jgi:hypothetical protein
VPLQQLFGPATDRPPGQLIGRWHDDLAIQTLVSLLEVFGDSIAALRIKVW